jgi:hypothetical protein
VITAGAPATEVDGLAVDEGVGNTGIFDIQLVDADNVSLDPLNFPPGAPQVPFTVRCNDPTPDGLCGGSGTVVVTDGEGLQCELSLRFKPVPAGPLEDFVLIDDGGTVLQITNPVPGSTDPVTEEGNGACTQNPFSPQEPPLGPGREPFELCDVITIDSPIDGLTEIVLKVDGDFEPRLRLMFSVFDETTEEFLPFVDITESVQEIPEVVPDPTRMNGTSRWSPVKITCALVSEVDCSDPLLTDVDSDGDGFSPCPSSVGPGACNDSGFICTSDAECPAGEVCVLPIDCDDRIGFVLPGAAELCNGVDDDCDTTIDEGFDGDGDGVADCFDNCPFEFNPPSTCDPLLPDFQCDGDADGVGDLCDNCILPNPGQEDADQDGVGDACEPQLEVELTPDLLWPANHKMKVIEAEIDATSPTGSPLQIRLVSIASNEPDDASGGGDGNTQNDIDRADFGTDDREFRLRAERDGAGSGRLYTVVYRATDGLGSTEVMRFVVVPHDQAP